MQAMDDVTRRHAMWIARAMARTDGSPLTASDILALEESCRPQRVTAGSVLLAAGQPARAAYIVRDGLLHLAVRNPSMGRQTVGLVQPGDVVGDLSIFLDRPMAVDVLADVDSTVLVVTQERLQGLLASSPSLALRWITSVAMRADTAQRRLITVLTKDLSAQVATLLLDHRVSEDGIPMVRMPHQTIAHLLGARRQSVSRVLGQMRRDGLVRSRYGAVELVDVNGIADIAGIDSEDEEDLRIPA